ncbi:ABC transporter ATP-binding protein [Clostridium ihumii]|uniref:ABC transporter ATP-binding protein n=1 Tax=Clostridium ihumii TaxID=1470356 RepID=UPI000AC536A2|nr:ABC transporter ATP-binding protein [Clostridium ihumii]
MEFNLEKKNYKTIDILKIPFNASKVYTILFFIIKLLNGLIPTIQVVVVGSFLDTAIAIFKNEKQYSSIIDSLVILIILIAYSWTSDKVLKLVESKLEIRLREAFKFSIVEKRSKVEYKYIENSKSWDLMSRVSKDAETKSKDALDNLLTMMEMSLRVIGLLVILFTKVWWTPIVILIISVPLFKLALKGGKASYEAERELSKYQRKFEYLGDVLTGREAVDERSLFQYTEAVNEKWIEQYETARKIECKVLLKWFVKMKSNGVITTLISVLIVVVFIKPVLNKEITVGFFIAISNAVFGIINTLSWRISWNVDTLAKNKEYLKDLTELINMKESEGAVEKPCKNSIDIESLEFKDVCFKYPGMQNYILKNLSFKIDAGRHYAFVGTNGAGKSTITKLITGLYDNFEGEILINNKSIREYRKADLKSMFAIVHQDFSKYFIKIKDNVALGNINKMENEKDDEYIKDAIRTVKLDEVVNILPNKINTELGKIKEGGVDLSGGQWQRLGIARAIVSNASLKILDEPTASLDPISESNMYEEFEKISRGGTTIFISHRLGSTKLADEIFVIDNGNVVENGSHDKLMSLDGIYKNMYESQRRWYL